MAKPISYIILPLFAAFVVYAAIDVIPMAFGYYKLYRWVALGIVAFLVIDYFVKHNMDFIKTFVHELSHTIVGMCCGRRILSFSAKEREGVVWSRGGGYTTSVFSSLAPYCLPYITYAMLLIWSLVASKTMVAQGSLWGIDLIIGLTLGLHFSCFWQQTGKYQPDINQFPLLFSYTYIWVFRLFNLLVILLVFMPGDKSEPLKLWGALWYMLKSLWTLVIGWF